MEVNKILSADVLDIVFDGRNKDYGAYDLRKTYNKRLGKALIGTAAVVGLLFAGYALSNLKGPEKKKAMIVQDVELEKLTAERAAAQPSRSRQFAGTGCAVSSSRISRTSVAGGVTLVVRASPIAWQPA